MNGNEEVTKQQERKDKAAISERLTQVSRESASE